MLGTRASSASSTRLGLRPGAAARPVVASYARGASRPGCGIRGPTTASRGHTRPSRRCVRDAEVQLIVWRCPTRCTCRPSRPLPRTARVSSAPSRSAGTARRPARWSRRARGRCLGTATLRTSVFGAETVLKVHEIVACRAHRRVLSASGPRGTQRPACAALLGCRVGRRRRAAGHGVALASRPPATSSARSTDIRGRVRVGCDTVAW